MLVVNYRTPDLYDYAKHRRYDCSFPFFSDHVRWLVLIYLRNCFLTHYPWLSPCARTQEHLSLLPNFGSDTEFLAVKVGQKWFSFFLLRLYKKENAHLLRTKIPHFCWPKTGHFRVQLARRNAHFLSTKTHQSYFDFDLDFFFDLSR